MQSELHELHIPRHVAIVMDGNGRWAKQHRRPRTWGHKHGVERVRDAVEFCIERGISALTLFAFSSENWRRPEQEVGVLMELLLSSLKQEMKKLHENGVRLRMIGNRSRFPEKLQKTMTDAEALTHDNQRLMLNVAVNYGGRWDITHAAQALAQQVADGTLQPADITEELMQQHLSLADLPEPDLFIRTGGEQRISNFLLWQIAYCEFYFTNRYWPEFDAAAFDEALQDFSLRQRRFGRTEEQLASSAQAT